MGYHLECSPYDAYVTHVRPRRVRSIPTKNLPPGQASHLNEFILTSGVRTSTRLLLGTDSCSLSRMTLAECHGSTYQRIEKQYIGSSKSGELGLNLRVNRSSRQSGWTMHLS